MTNLSHRASFHSFERITPSNRGIKHLGDACIHAKDDFENGKFFPESKKAADHLKKFSGIEVMTSRAVAEYNGEPLPTFTIEFIDGLPIPESNWSIDGIMKFRERNFSQRQAFWSTISMIMTEANFLNDPTPELTLRQEILNGADEYAIKSAETFGKRIRDAISFDFSPKSVIPVGAALSFDSVHELFSLGALPIGFTVFAGALGFVSVKLSLKPSHPPMSQTARGLAYYSKIRAS